jgi:hypothetical protein
MAQSYIFDPKGGRWGSGTSGSITRNEIKVPPGGKSKDNYWCSSSDHEFCNGYLYFAWEGADDGGHRIAFNVKVKLQHTGCPKQLAPQTTNDRNDDNKRIYIEPKKLKIAMVDEDAILQAIYLGIIKAVDLRSLKLNEAYSQLSKRIVPVIEKYAQENGFTVVVNSSGQGYHLHNFDYLIQYLNLDFAAKYINESSLFEKWKKQMLIAPDITNALIKRMEEIPISPEN